MVVNELWTGRDERVVGAREAGDTGTTELTGPQHAVVYGSEDGTQVVALCSRVVRVWGQRAFDPEAASGVCLDCARVAHAAAPHP